MSRRSQVMDRAVRIELLRARAAIERETLAESIVQAGRALAPATLASQILPSLAGRKTGKLLWQAFGLARRYPLISSSVSALIMGGKRGRMFKLLASSLAGWQLWTTWQKRKHDDKGR